MLLPAAVNRLTRSRYQSDGFNVVSEAAFEVMVLAMNIAGNRATDGHELRAGCYNLKPASGYKNIQYVGETNARRARE
jgi:hypothetical protein